jgi:hypothetical protein
LPPTPQPPARELRANGVRKLDDLLVTLQMSLTSDIVFYDDYLVAQNGVYLLFYYLLLQQLQSTPGISKSLIKDMTIWLIFNFISKDMKFTMLSSSWFGKQSKSAPLYRSYCIC